MVELAVSLGFCWMALHAPRDGTPLLIEAGLVAGWAALGRGPLGVVRLVGLRAHARGILALAGALLIVPVAAGRLSDATLWATTVAGVAVLVRTGLVRWPDPPEAPERPLAGATRRSARGAGTMSIHPARVGIHDIARIAGRVVGRSRARRRL